MTVHSIFVTLLLFHFSASRLLSQDTLSGNSEQQLENLGEMLNDEEADLTQLTENLKKYQKDPLNLNRAGREELEELGLLNEIQVSNLLKHIEKNGKLISIYELQSIDGFDHETIRNILPFVEVKEDLQAYGYSFRDVFKNGKHEIIFRGSRVLEHQTGYSSIDSMSLCSSPNSRYVGDPNKIYARYRFTYSNKISFGITAEKDPGELMFENSLKNNYPCYAQLLDGKMKNGFDFYSAHFFIRNLGKIRALALGDFQAGFGQGLIAWTGLAYGKSYDGISIRRNANGLKPHTGTDENLFLRGAGITLGFGPLEFTTFGSYKKIDANITVFDTLAGNDATEFSSLQTSGYHTTVSELQDRKQLGEMITGGNITFRKRRFKAGLTGVYTQFDAELTKSIALYNQFDFQGTSSANFSADYSWVVKNANLFGEVAMSDNGGLATVNGLMVAADPRFSFSLLHRYYDRSFQGLHANGFGEGSNTNNEQGFYFGINAKLDKAWTLSGYYDRFVFNWLKYGVSAPSEGNEIVGQLSFIPSKKLDLYFRVRKKDKLSDNTSSVLDAPVAGDQLNLRFNLIYSVSKAVKLKNRVEYIIYNNGIDPAEEGYMIYQDVVYKKPGSRISFNLRYALFDTKSYDSRIYAYENDLPGSFSIPSLYEKGTRTYLNINYDISRNIEIWLRLSRTWYANKDIISEGSLYEINGNAKTEGKVMLRIKL